jgi:uncharacterized membrane protein
MTGKHLKAAFDFFPMTGKHLKAAFDFFPMTGKHLKATFDFFPMTGKHLKAIFNFFPAAGKTFHASLDRFRVSFGCSGPLPFVAPRGKIVPSSFSMASAKEIRMPPIPPWEALHPVVVHFPIALLLVVPIFVVLALVQRRQRPGLSQAALVLLLLGTVGAWVAVQTGEAAEGLVEGVAGVGEVLEEHEHGGERARNFFTGLTLLYAGIVLLPAILKREPSAALYGGLNAVFLVLYLFAVVSLANTASLGGRLVHEFGVLGAPASPGAFESTEP